MSKKQPDSVATQAAQTARIAAVLQSIATDDIKFTQHSSDIIDTSINALQQRIPPLNESKKNIIYNQLSELRNNVYKNNDNNIIHNNNLHISTLDIVIQWLCNKLLNNNYIQTINNINKMSHTTTTNQQQQNYIYDTNNILTAYHIDRTTLSQSGIYIIQNIHYNIYIYVIDMYY